MAEFIPTSSFEMFKQHYDRIKETLEKDQAGFASTILHPTIARFNGWDGMTLGMVSLLEPIKP